ncbi:MAG: hypothetical protein GC131_05690 [Alphaproteobacteria bacterium]|nr:hypothetical protein [Alphaproteobacteria bacterium]
MILLAHAYSRANQGDSLMVDLAMALIKRALPDAGVITVGASDAASFSDLPHILQIPGVTGARRAREAAIIARDIAFAHVRRQKIRYPLYDRLRSQVRMVVGVGGGYLRSGRATESGKTAIAHLPQLMWTVGSGLPSLYLPLSIGPLDGPVGSMIRTVLRGIDCVCLRDDRSVAALGPHKNMLRAPDLTINELFRTQDLYNMPRAAKTYLIARDLPRTRFVRAQYIARLKQLRALLPEIEVITQSAVRSNNDEKFYRELGWGETFRTTQQVIAARDTGVMVSVRLHGTLMGLLGGMPAVHLVYERKGVGACNDLGIPDYAHSATHFDPRLVARQVRALQNDAGSYWLAIAARRGWVEEQEDQIIAAMRGLYGVEERSSQTAQPASA